MVRSVPQRLGQLIEPLPGSEEARAFSVLALAAATLACAFSLYYGFRGETFLGRPLGLDFAQFYVAGQILNQHQPSLLYDLTLVSSLQHRAVPRMPSEQILVFAYAPCVAQLFRPLAMLPYVWAFCVWLAFSMALYAGGLLILFRRRLPRGLGHTAFLLSLSAPLYTVETWLGGQFSVVTFFVVVLFVHYFESRRFLVAGLVLGLASGKPSLVAIPAAVMLLSASWRMLAGLCTSSAFLVLASDATAGINGVERWIHTVRLYGTLATTGNTILHRTKYVDLNSFFAILLGVNPISRILAAVSISAAFLFLARACWKARRQPLEERRYLWAGALAWTPIVNIYVGVYDALVVVPAAALVAYSVAYEHGEDQSALRVWVTILWLAPWVSQPAADYLRVQTLTVVLAAFGFWALTLAGRTAQRATPAVLAA